MKIKSFLTAVLVLATSCLTTVCAITIEANPVEAAGSTSTNITASDSGQLTYFASQTGSWLTLISGDATSEVGTGSVGFYANDSGNAMIPIQTVLEFDTSGIPAGSEITGGYIYFDTLSKYDTSAHHSDFYWSVYKISDTGAAVDVTDNSKVYDNGVRISAPDTFLNVTGSSNHEIDIVEDMLEYALEPTDGDSVFYSLVTENQALCWPPTQDAAGQKIRFDFTCNTAKLCLTYTAPADDRIPVLHTNAAIDDTILGNETADNITLETPRYVYADDSSANTSYDLSFLVNGDSGANCTLQLQNAAGEILETAGGTSEYTVRVDGIYAWQLDLDSDTDDIVRCYEVNNNLYSDWVAVKPAPDDTEATNHVYAEYTDHPQYTRDFAAYVVQGGDIMTVHWKTNIDGSSELGDYAMVIRPNGDDSAELFNVTFEDLAEDYLGGSAANQAALSHWRFMLFTTGKPAGFNDYNGLIVSLGISSDTTKRGFVEYLVTDNATGDELAPMQSAYWNVENAAEGIGIALSDDNIKADQEPIVRINIGGQCKVERNLALCYIEVISTGSYSYSQVEKGVNQVQLPAVTTEGTYTVRVHLYDTSKTSYEYVKDLTLTISETGISEDLPEDAGGIWGKIQEFIIGKGWDLTNPVTRLIIVFVAMVIVFLIFFPMSRAAAIGFALLVLGIALIAEWVDAWLIVLLALGAGLMLWQIFRKKQSGGENQG